MSVQIMSWAFAQKVGSSTEKAVLLALANRANHDTGECHPSLKRVAEETELSYPTVKRAATSLVEKGFITRDRRRRADGSYSGYTYRFPRTPGITDDQPELAVIPGPEITVIPQEPEEDLGPSAVPDGTAAPNPHDLLSDFIDHARESGADPPRRVVGQLAREIKTLVDEGAGELELRAALGRLSEKSLNPSTLASLLFEVRQRGGPASNGSGDVLGSFLDRHDGKWPTGSRLVRGEGGAATLVQDPLGYDKPTHAVPWGKPTRDQILHALKGDP